MSRGTCIKCKYFLLQVRTPSERGNADGKCFRNPPTLFLLPGQDGPTLFSDWPPVNSNRWCGQYEPKVVN